MTGGVIGPFCVNTKAIADPFSAQLIITYIERGKYQCQSFMKGSQSDQSSLYQPIRKNKIIYFLNMNKLSISQGVWLRRKTVTCLSDYSSHAEQRLGLN